MNAGRVCHFSRADNSGHVQVALARLRRSDTDGLVRQQHVLQIVVGRRVHRDRLDAHLAAGAQNSKRDLATIGNYDFIQHVGGLA